MLFVDTTTHWVDYINMEVETLKFVISASVKKLQRNLFIHRWGIKDNFSGRQIRTIKGVCIFEINGMEVFL